VRGSGRGGACSVAAPPPPHSRVLTVEEGQRVIAAALFSAAELTDMSLETQNRQAAGWRAAAAGWLLRSPDRSVDDDQLLKRLLEITQEVDSKYTGQVPSVTDSKPGSSG
jgi:hypothetical protein